MFSKEYHENILFIHSWLSFVNQENEKAANNYFHWAYVSFISAELLYVVSFYKTKHLTRLSFLWLN